MMGRISPPKALEEDLERLVTPDPLGRHPLFETKQKALMFAAALGKFRAQSRTPVERKGEGIRYDIFVRSDDDGFVDALAISEIKNLMILSDAKAEERTEIFEEYAQAGLKEMIERCFHQPGDPLEALLALVDEARSGPVEGLDEIDRDALRRLMGE